MGIKFIVFHARFTRKNESNSVVTYVNCRLPKGNILFGFFKKERGKSVYKSCLFSAISMPVISELYECIKRMAFT